MRGLGAAHDERRGAILEAVFAIVDTEGTHQVTIRRVADRAGVSVGRVQHYFPSKDDLLTAAFTAVNDLGAARVRDRLAGRTEPALVLRAVLTEIIPRTDDDRRLFRIMQAFETHALTQPHLRERIKQGYEELAALLELMAPSKAHELIALANGLAGLVLTGNLTPARAQEIVLVRSSEVLGE